MFVHALGKSAGLEVTFDALVALRRVRTFNDRHYTLPVVSMYFVVSV